MACATLYPERPAHNHEDYTGAVTLLVPNGWTVIDIEDFERLVNMRWRACRVGKNREARVMICGSPPIYLHRYLMSPPAGLIVDHANRLKWDNRKSNLRVCAGRENNLNRAGNASSTSRFKGVAWTVAWGKWTVISGPKGAKVYLGSFDDEVEAARAYNAYAREHFGPFAYLNPV